ncbi:MAG TPA: hypothetical protein VLC91_10235 [Spongiibacteraceae bacterium]|nr:hypothetical protein [Spongiibacteraceae bacterium]
MEYGKGFRRLFLMFGFVLLLGGCGGSKSNSDTAPVAIAPPDSPVVAALLVTTDSNSVATLPSSVVIESNVAMTNWTSNFFTVSGTCTTLPTPSLTLDATAKIITATLNGGTCTAGQSLTVSVDPTAITFAAAVSDSGALWTRTYTIPAIAQVAVGGSISGLTGTLVLQNNGGDAQAISTDGHFTFPTAVDSGATYAVTVQTQPAGLTCSVSNGSGTAGAVDISDVTIVCSVNAYRIGYTVSGLSGSVVLQNNAGDDQTINSDGTFMFAASIAHGATYAVTVLTQPAGQTCSVGNGSGVMGIANVTDVTVVCSTNTYTVGGVASSLSGSLVLQNNGGDSLTLNSNGSFTFSTPVAEGATYNVTVLTQPAAQTCSVSNGSGTMGGSNVTNVSVTCTTNTTTLSVSATGTIPVNGSAGTLTVTNTGTNTAYNVSAALPGGWTDITQDASDCAAITPSSTCTLSFTSTTPYVAQGGIQVTGDNIDMPPETALAFSIDGYLVYAVSGTSPSAKALVIAGSNASSSQRWSVSSDNISGITETSTAPPAACNGATDGACNTGQLDAFYGTPYSNYAAGLCQQISSDNTGAVSLGTWYLPAVCEMGGAGANCVPGSADIDTNLVQLGFGGLSGSYWSSTESSGAPLSTAWFADFATGGGSSQNNAFKSNSFGVRCARSIIF